MRKALTILAGLAAGLLLLGVLAGQTTAQPTGKRIALVIGNQSYDSRSGGALKNSLLDAERMASALERTGFEVIRANNQNRDGMFAQVAAFADRLASAGPNSVAFFYYSGHGQSQDGVNFLIPVGEASANLNLAQVAVSLDHIQATLLKANPAAIFLVSDACRDELAIPTGNKGVDKGFSAVPSRPGVFTAYATAPGSTTPDDGLYSQWLSYYITQPNLEASRAFTLASREVAKTRPLNKLPFFVGALNDDFCFLSCDPPPLVSPCEAVSAEYQRTYADQHNPATIADLQAFQRRVPATCTTLRDLVALKVASLETGRCAAPTEEWLATTSRSCDRTVLENFRSRVPAACEPLARAVGDQLALCGNADPTSSYVSACSVAQQNWRPLINSQSLPTLAAFRDSVPSDCPAVKEAADQRYTAVACANDAARWANIRGSVEVAAIDDFARSVYARCDSLKAEVAARRAAVAEPCQTAVKTWQGLSRGTDLDGMIALLNATPSYCVAELTPVVKRIDELDRNCADQASNWASIRGTPQLAVVETFINEAPSYCSKEISEAQRRACQIQDLGLDALGASPDPGAVLVALNRTPAYCTAVKDRASRLLGMAPSSRPGTFRDCPSCPEMVLIPGAEFRYGSPRGEAGRDDDEDDRTGGGGGQIKVTIGKPFALSRGETTIAEWTACSDAGVCPRVASSGPADAPVTGISWDAAQVYVGWLNRQARAARSEARYRLPYEMEWEYAAKSGLGDLAAANPCKGGSSLGACMSGSLLPTSALSSNAFGLVGMVGNVWEWTQDCRTEALSTRLDPNFGTECMRIIRGGSYASQSAQRRPSSRGYDAQDGATKDRGFRVAADVF